ncbi:hypothetical protein [Glycomyces paridis]|uniref:Uncharacterized protein n=1 Tax=Glycomyces paridis TaxID=2126555 RepID=A0A4S8PBR4_9ACTN|nr:hypothetical protein [Glycomyces paridis]THV26995.1 hypothetical protein E9998_16055 [Glycomyces paridis]
MKFFWGVMYALVAFALGVKVIVWLVTWLITHALPFVILGLIAAIVFFVVWCQNKLEQRSANDPARIIEEADRLRSRTSGAEVVLENARQKLEAKGSELQGIVFRQYDELRFDFLKKQHFESMSIADEWHRHKNIAIQVRRDVSGSLSQLKGRKQYLDRRLNQRSYSGRRRELREFEAVKYAVDSLFGSLERLKVEILRGEENLSLYNNRTGGLRDHIGNNCGKAGREWYTRLELRKQQRLEGQS